MDDATAIHTGHGNININQSRHVTVQLFAWPIDAVRRWAVDFFRVEEADEHARSSWAGMTLYGLGAAMQRISSESFLTLLLVVVVATLALWFVAPLLAWPQPDLQERFLACVRFAGASLLLPLFIAALIQPEGREKFTTAATAEDGASAGSARIYRRLLLLKLAGAWTGFGALSGTVLIVAILWYHLFGQPLPLVGRWLLTLLPPFFAYVSARRIPLDRYKMFDGQLRLHAADPLFAVVFALFGPALAAVVYWGHWFLINQGAMLAVLLAIVALTIGQIRQQDPQRFPDPLLILILGLLLPLGFLLLFFFDMAPVVPPPTFARGEVGLFVALSIYLFGITLVLATVGVRQRTLLTIQIMLAFLVMMLLLLGALLIDLWIGRVAVVGVLLFWYLWGRQWANARQWFVLHPSVDGLVWALIAAAVLGRFTAIPLWLNATLFGLIAALLCLWAYRVETPIGEIPPVPTDTEATATTATAVAATTKSPINAQLLSAMIVLALLITAVAVLWGVGRWSGLQPVPVTHFVITEWTFDGSMTTKGVPTTIYTEGVRSTLYEKLALVDGLAGIGRFDPTLLERNDRQVAYWIQGRTQQKTAEGLIELSASIARGNDEFLGTVSVEGPVDGTESGVTGCLLILQQQLALQLLEKLAVRPSAESVAAMAATPTTDCKALALNNQAAEEIVAGHPDGAIYRLEEALHLDPNYGDAYNNMSRGFYQRGEFDTAVAFAQKALAQQPRNPIYNYNLGLAYERTGTHEDAIAAYQRALDEEPLYVNALNNLGFTLLLTGNITDAQAQIDKGLALDDMLPALHKNRGRILLEQGEPAAAVRAFEAAMTQSGTEPFPEALFYLAVAQHQLGDSGRACATLTTYGQSAAADESTRVKQAASFWREWQCVAQPAVAPTVAR